MYNVLWRSIYFKSPRVRYPVEDGSINKSRVDFRRRRRCRRSPKPGNGLKVPRRPGETLYQRRMLEVEREPEGRRYFMETRNCCCNERVPIFPSSPTPPSAKILFSYAQDAGTPVWRIALMSRQPAPCKRLHYWLQKAEPSHGCCTQSSHGHLR